MSTTTRPRLTRNSHFRSSGKESTHVCVLNHAVPALSHLRAPACLLRNARDHPSLWLPSPTPVAYPPSGPIQPSKPRLDASPDPPRPTAALKRRAHPARAAPGGMEACVPEHRTQMPCLNATPEQRAQRLRLNAVPAMGALQCTPHAISYPQAGSHSTCNPATSVSTRTSAQV